MPQKFGETVNELIDVYNGYKEGVFRYGKSDFSMLEPPVWEKI